MTILFHVGTPTGSGAPRMMWKQMVWLVTGWLWYHTSNTSHATLDLELAKGDVNIETIKHWNVMSTLILRSGTPNHTFKFTGDMHIW